MGTNFPTTLDPDPAVSLDANYRLSAADRRLIDGQILGIQGVVKKLLAKGVVATYFLLDGGSAAVAAGDVVCSAANSAAVSVTLATSTILATAGAPAGVVLAAAQPGNLVLVAIAGIVPATVTGLGAAAGLVRVNAGTTTSRAQKVTSYSTGDYPLGSVDTVGNLTLVPLTSANVGGGGSGAIAVEQAGTVVGTRATINFPSGATVVDDPANNRVNITPSGGGGSFDYDTLEAHGAVGNDSTDDTAAFNSLNTALQSGASKAVQLETGKTYVTSVGINARAGNTIVGRGENSVIKITANTPAITILGDNVTLRDFTILGSGTGASQHGISNGVAATPSSGYQKQRTFNVRGESLGGALYYFAQSPTGSAKAGPMLVGVSAESCGYGIYIDTLGEYMSVTNPQFHACGTGMYVGAGNFSSVGGWVTECTNAGVNIAAGTNGAHGVIAGMMLNHDATIDNIVVGAIANGFAFVGCKIYQGTIHLTSSKGVRFTACDIDMTTYYFDGSYGTWFDACLFPTGYANTFNHNFNGHPSQTTIASNCRNLAGSFPFGATAYDGVHCAVTLSANTAISGLNLETTVIPFDTILGTAEATNSSFTYSTIYDTTNHRWTAPTTTRGLARFRGQFTISYSGGVDALYVWVVKNGSTRYWLPILSNSSLGRFWIPVDLTIPCVSGDTFQIQIASTAATTTATVLTGSTDAPATIEVEF